MTYFLVRRWIVILFPCILVKGVLSLDLTITPEHIHVTANSTFNIMCQSSEPIESCQFKEYFKRKIYYLSQGKHTPHTPDYQYYGTGLEYGQCGISVKKNLDQYTIFECRVRTFTSRWTYAATTVNIGARKPFNFNIYPRSATVLPGSNVSILCQADQALSKCSLKWLAGGWHRLYQTTVTSEKQYYGKGLNKGYCGVTILNVTDNMNGIVACQGFQKKKHASELKTMSLTVAKPPNTPLLLLDTSDFIDGEILHASCDVSNSRPVANVTWFLDDIVVRKDTINEALPEVVWRSKDEQNIKQNLKWKLSWKDNGRKLKCQAGHLALESGVLDSRTIRINVKYSPKQRERTIFINDLHFGQEGQIKVNVSANPKPTITWKIGNTSFSEGQRDLSGRMKAAEIVFNEDDQVWTAMLNISQVLDQDFSQDIFLTAGNELGETTHTIRVNIKPAVATTNTDSDPICYVIGIGLGVLALSLVVATIAGLAVKRWYFTTSPPIVTKSQEPEYAEILDLSSWKCNSELYNADYLNHLSRT